MATNRAPRNAKPLMAKVMALIEGFPSQSQVEVCQWLSGQIRTEILPELRAQMKTAAKEEAGTTRRRSTRSTSARGGTRGQSTAKRRAAAKKAAATRKARGTQRGGRRERTNTTSQTNETQIATEAATHAVAA